MMFSAGRVAVVASALSPSIVDVVAARIVPLNYHVARSSNETKGDDDFHALPIPIPSPDDSSVSSADAPSPSPTDLDEYTDAPVPTESEEAPIDDDIDNDPLPTDWVSSDIQPPSSSSSSSSSTFSFFFPSLGPIITTSIVPSSYTHSSTPTTSRELTCVSQDPYSPTTIVVSHTETTTFYGDPSDYTPPHPELTLPPICQPGAVGGDGDDNAGNGWESFTTPGPSAPAEEPFPSETYTFVTTDKNPSVVFKPSEAPGFGHGSMEHHIGDDPETKANQDRPLQPTITKDRPQGVPTPDRNGGGGGGGNPPPVQAPPVTPTFVVTADPGRVIIDDKTISVKPDQTTTTKINGEDFVINPTQVIGGGHTVHRPWFGDGSGGNGPVVPSRTHVGTVPIVMAPSGHRSQVVIDGTRVTIPPDGTALVVAGGTTVSLEPTAIHFPERKLELRNKEPTPTEILVEGGQMITALGHSQVVIEGTTLTYGGPGDEPTITTIGEDVIVLGPEGVVVGGTHTLGGPSATPDATSYKIVGGVAVTQIGASLVAIAGETYTVGPEMDSTITTAIGGEMITVGPEGVVIDETMSLTYPFGPQVVSTLSVSPEAAAVSAAASQTADPERTTKAPGDGGEGEEDKEKDESNDDDESEDDADDDSNDGDSDGPSGVSGNHNGNGKKDDNGGASMRMSLGTAALSVSICIAMGVWNML